MQAVHLAGEDRIFSRHNSRDSGAGKTLAKRKHSPYGLSKYICSSTTTYHSENWSFNLSRYKKSEINHTTVTEAASGSGYSPWLHPEGQLVAVYGVDIVAVRIMDCGTTAQRLFGYVNKVSPGDCSTYPELRSKWLGKLPPHL